MVLKPLFNKTLVHPEEKEEKGILLGEKSPNELIRARVIDVGNGKLKNFTNSLQNAQDNIQIPFINGDFIYFSIFDAKPVTIDGETYYMLECLDVYGKE